MHCNSLTSQCHDAHSTCYMCNIAKPAPPRAPTRRATRATPPCKCSICSMENRPPSHGLERNLAEQMWHGKSAPVADVARTSLYGSGVADALLFTYRAQRRYPPGIPTFGPARFFALQAQSSKIFGAVKVRSLPSKFSPACGFEMEREGSESSKHGLRCYICYASFESSNFACYMLHACSM